MPIPPQDKAAADILRRRLLSACIPQDDLAGAAGFSRGHLNRILRGRHRLPLRVVAVAESLLAAAPPPNLAKARRRLARAQQLLERETGSLDRDRGDGGQAR